MNFKLNEKTSTFIILIISAAVTITSQSIITTGLKYLMSDFNIPSSTAQLSYSVFLLTLGVMIPATAYIFNRFKLKSILITALSLFITGSFIVSIAPNMEILLIGRILEATCSGIIMPLTQIVIFKIMPEEKWSLIMGLYGLIVGFMPAIGPTVGGFIIAISSWRTIFVIFTILGIITLILSALVIKIDIDRTPQSLDVISLILSVIFCIGIMLGFTNISEHGNNLIYVILPIILGLISLILFVRRQKRVTNPLINLNVLKSKYFVYGTTFISLLYFTMCSINVLIPLFVQNIANHSAITSGLVIMPSTLVLLLFNFIGPLLADKIGIKKVLIISGIFSIIGFISMMTYNLNSSIEYMIITQIIRGTGAGLGLTPATTWTMSIVAYDVEDATAINNTLRQISGAIGSAISVVILTLFADGKLTNNTASVNAFANTSLIMAIIIIITMYIAVRHIKNKEDIRKEIKNG